MYVHRNLVSAVTAWPIDRFNHQKAVSRVAKRPLNMPSRAYMFRHMTWLVEHTNEFEIWFNSLSSSEQEDVYSSGLLLEQRGPNLRHPMSSGIKGSRHGHMRELRVQSGGKPLRIFYAFDPRRAAILLIGGDKAGDDRFYVNLVPVADDLYDTHLQELEREKRDGEP